MGDLNTGSSRQTSQSGANSRASASGQTLNRRRDVCVFWVAGQCFGLDVSIVGEVVAVAAVTPVPLAPPGVLGLFNLRGAPMVLLEMASILRLSSSGPARVPKRVEDPLAATRALSASSIAHVIEAARVAQSTEGFETRREGLMALLLRAEGVSAAASIESMESVVELSSKQLARGDAGDPLVEGFFEVDTRGGVMVTMLSAEALIARLAEFRAR